MDIKCLKGFAGTAFSGSAGEIKRDFPDDVARDLIRAGYAVEEEPLRDTLRRAVREQTPEQVKEIAETVRKAARKTTKKK